MAVRRDGRHQKSRVHIRTHQNAPKTKNLPNTLKTQTPERPDQCKRIDTNGIHTLMSVNALGEAAHRMFACGQVRDAEEGMVARNADEMVAHLAEKSMCYS